MLRDAGVTAEMAKQLESGEVALSEFADAINSKRVSKDLNDRITGHSQKDVAGKYGLGEALITRAAAIEKLDLSFLPEWRVCLVVNSRRLVGVLEVLT